MSFPLTIYMDQRSSDITDTLETGKMAFYFINNIVKIRYGSTTRTLDIGVTIEEIQDLLANTFQDTSSIKWIYDDAANVYRANLSQSMIDNISSALQPGSSITNLDNNAGYETPAQLSSRDSLNRQRSNHSGTQLASTISDFDAAISDYLDRYSEQNLNYSTNTTTTNAVLVNKNFTPKHTSKYLIKIQFGHSYDLNTSDMVAEMLINGSVVKRLRKEPKDVGGSDGSSGTNQFELGMFMYEAALTQSNSINIKFQHKADIAGNESTIKGYTLTIERF